jgi:Ca2+-binding RTX toxin-like protein
MMMNFIIVLAILSIVMILLSVPSSVLFVQNASALASVAQITSAKADSTNLVNGGFATIAQGKTTVRVTFDYRGFDDNDHVLELRCSWDGVNYLKSNCSTESAESRTTFTGPDGVARAYYVKTGTASRDLPAPPVPKTYTFGVKVLNENGNLSPAATWSFKMRASTSPPVGGTQEGENTSTNENFPNTINCRSAFPCYGTAQADNMQGDDGVNVMYGMNGGDSMDGGEGNNILNGGQGSDNIYGGNGVDRVSGGPGSDLITTGWGNDIIYHGNRPLLGTTGASGPDGSKDIIDCGPGIDEVFINKADGDEAHDCEKVNGKSLTG